MNGNQYSKVKFKKKPKVETDNAGWVYTKCKECGIPLQYWSKNGKADPKRNKIKCADHTCYGSKI